MNCLEYRRQCLIDPGNDDEEFARHANNCRACADFCDRILYMEKTLADAVNISVPENLNSDIMLRQSMQNSRKSYRQVYFALAASLVIMISAAFMIEWQIGKPGLEDVVISYVESARANNINGPAGRENVAVSDVLRPLGMTLGSEFGPVQSAKPCIIRGKDAAHIVVPGKTGTVDIIYMPGETISRRQEMQQQGNKLLLVPCPKGSLALVGSYNEQLAEIEKRFQTASQWL